VVGVVDVVAVVDVALEATVVAAAVAAAVFDNIMEACQRIIL